MNFSIALGLTSLLEAMPSDVLTHIALDTVSLYYNIPSPRELTTVRSLVLTSRNLHQKLSPTNNPHLYANIFRLMFDVEAVMRRLGAHAVVSVPLTSELKRRVEVLKRVKARLDTGDGAQGATDTILNDLARMFLMMTENDGKNRHQLVDVLGLSRVPNFFYATLVRSSLYPGEHTANPHLTLIIALMWMSSDKTLIGEDPDLRTVILDLLQPFVLGTESCLATSTFSSERRQYSCSVTNIEYFGLRCKFSLPSVIPFARLCTVDTYNAVNQSQKLGSGETCLPMPSWSSARFDDDWSRYITVAADFPPVAPGTVGSPPRLGLAPSTFEGLWEGTLFIPCAIDPVPQVFTCARRMQAHLREYVSFSAASSVFLSPGEEGVSVHGLPMAWLSEGIVFDETPTHLRVYDPTMAQWAYYWPRSHVSESSVVWDTILVGETDPSHGASFGDYTFYGRVLNNVGRVALVRKPTDPQMDDHGTWVFFGQVQGRNDLVGDWRNTSTEKYIPAGQGWFHLSKVGTDP